MFGFRGTARSHQLRRRLVLLVALTVTGTGIGTALGVSQASSVSAEARILVAPLDGNPFSPESDDLINLETEAQLVSSESVARAVSASADIPEQAALGGVSVSVLPNTQVLSISFAAGSGSVAREVSQTFAEEFLDYRSGRAARVEESRSERIQSQIDDLGENLADLIAQLDETTESSRTRVMREQISGINSQVAQLRTQLDQVRTGAQDPGEITTPAYVSSPSPTVLIGGAAVAGGLVGLAAALSIIIFRVRAENKVHLTEDIEAVGLNLLGDVGEPELAAMLNRSAEGWEEGSIGPELRALRAAIFARERRRPVRLLVGTSAAGDTGPRAAVGLAYAAAVSGYRTLLVDATADGRMVTDRLGLSRHRGLADVLRGDISLEDSLVNLADHLQVVPAGALDPRSDDRLSGPRVTTLFERISDVSDIAVVATGPLLEARSQALALVNDACLVEAVQGVSSIDELVEIANDLDDVNFLGVVFVRPQRASGGAEPKWGESGVHHAGRWRRGAAVDASA